jgi:glutathione S-transferase
MQLYYAPASSYSQRVLIALYEKNASFTPREVNLFDAEARQQYLKINPFGKIPTLITDDEKVLFEAGIIIEYLDNYLQNTPRLIPLNPELALEVRFLERVIDVYVNAGREALFADSQLPCEERGGKNVKKACRLLESAIALLDERLASRNASSSNGGNPRNGLAPWLAGEEFTLADCAAAPTLAYLRLVYDYQHLPKLTEYFQRLGERESVNKAFIGGREQMTQMLSTLRYPVVISD